MEQGESVAAIAARPRVRKKQTDSKISAHDIFQPVTRGAKAAGSQRTRTRQLPLPRGGGLRRRNETVPAFITTNP